MTNTATHEKDILALHLGGWQWPAPGTWTHNDVIELLRRSCGVKGLDQIFFNGVDDVFVVVHGNIQRLAYDRPTIDDCRTIILALGGPMMSDTR